MKSPGTILFVVLATILKGYTLEIVHELYSISGMQGFRVYAFHNATHRDKYVAHLQAKLDGFDILRVPQSIYKPIELLVSYHELEDFKRNLKRWNLRHDVFAEDVSKVLKKRWVQQMMARSVLDDLANRNSLNVPKQFNLRFFPRYAEIKQFLTNIVNTHSEIASLFNMGLSFESRDLLGIKLSTGLDKRGKAKPILFIDAGIRARDWIAPTTAMYAAKELTENLNNRPLLENVDVYIVPLLNPDGYEYSHQNLETRMWRKTRATNENSNCRGVDASRNFGFKRNNPIATNDMCSDTYSGRNPFSEPETSALRDYMLSLNGRIMVYLTFHSHGNNILHPWGYTSEEPKNAHIMLCVAENAAAELSKVRGTYYTVGSFTNVLYAAAGGSSDWAMAKGGAVLAYTLELPGGEFGFAVPPSAITPTGQETFEAIKVFIEYVEGKICHRV